MGPSLTSSKVKEEETKYAYDTYGRVTKTTYANGIFDQVDYNDTERQITSTDKKGNTTAVTYSIYGQKLKRRMQMVILNHILQNKPASYIKIISDIKHNKKKILKAVKKEALKAAIKVGIRTIFPITLLSAAWALTKGGSKGYKHTIKNMVVLTLSRRYMKIMDSRCNDFND